MGFDDQPNALAYCQVERTERAGRDLDEKKCARIDAADHSGAASFEEADRAFEDVARAEALGFLRCKQDVSRTNGDVNTVACHGVTQRNFHFSLGTGDAGAHDAVGFADVLYDRGEVVFEARSTGEAFFTRRVKNRVGYALGRDTAAVHGDHSFTQSIHFIALMRDIQNRYLANAVPGTQVVDDGRLQFGVQPFERFVKQQGTGRSSQRSSKRDALRFAAGNLPGFALGKVRHAESVQKVLYTQNSFFSGQIMNAEGDILMGRQVRKESW